MEKNNDRSTSPKGNNWAKAFGGVVFPVIRDIALAARSKGV